MATAPSVTNGIVVVVVGGRVVVVVVEVLVVVDVEVVVEVLVDEVDVVVVCVVVVATDGGPNVQAASTTDINAVEIDNSRRANTRSSCPVLHPRTSHFVRRLVFADPIRVRKRQTSASLACVWSPGTPYGSANDKRESGPGSPQGHFASVAVKDL